MTVSERERAGCPPRLALGLSAFGVVPFAALAAAAWIGDPETASAAVFAVAAYGAVILSFIAGAHWGFASLKLKEQNTPASRLLAWSVVPSLVGWTALLLPAPWSLAVLGMAVAAVLFLDRWAAEWSLAPGWWLRLRTPLSATVSGLLFVAFAAALLRFGP